MWRPWGFSFWWRGGVQDEQEPYGGEDHGLSSSIFDNMSLLHSVLA